MMKNTFMDLLDLKEGKMVRTLNEVLENAANAQLNLDCATVRKNLHDEIAEPIVNRLMAITLMVKQKRNSGDILQLLNGTIDLLTDDKKNREIR
ncbi:MAG: hypothetical protein B7C24_14270 [Bacteroidetes bacterium 4572_77]|nr:MAG: hypothetical protein B7C24_14270 [Bacteroidetes bacterium 4572_77]